MKEREALKPCPFCGVRLVPNNNHSDLYVRRYGTHYAHPRSLCHLSEHEVSPGQVADWNARASLEASQAQEAAEPKPLGALLTAYGKAFHAAKLENGKRGTEERANAARAAVVAALKEPPPASVAPIPTEEQIGKHALRAGDCPPDSQVLLVSSVRRLQAKAEVTAATSTQASEARPEPVARDLEYGYCNVAPKCDQWCGRGRCVSWFPPDAPSPLAPPATDAAR